MQTSILKIEVRHKQKHVATIVRHASEETLMIGQTKKAHLKLINSEVSPVHAVIRYEDKGWWIRDLGSQSGTWVNKKAIVESELQSGHQVRIGQHDIYISTYDHDSALFAKDFKPEPKGQSFHQIVVKVNKKLYRTHLLGATEKFVWRGKEFSAPTGAETLSHDVDGYVIEQRQVCLDKELKASTEKADGLTRETMMATGTVGVLFAIFLIFSLISFTKPGMDIKLPEAKTAKFVPLKMKDSKVFVPEMDAAPGAQAKESSSSSAVKGIAASFSAVLGRVSQRLNKAAINIQKPGSVQTGTSNSVAAVGMAGASKEGVSGLIGKIGQGTGNGQGNVQVMGGGGVAGIGHLQQGGVGSGQVAAQEDESEVMGGLDKEVIAKIIRSYLGQIRYCYERQLSATPELYGKLLVQFSIGQAGTVNTQSILSSSLQNKNVEGCVLRQVAAWKFPQPKGGTIVKVSYPFLFTSTK